MCHHYEISHLEALHEEEETAETDEVPEPKPAVADD